MLSMKSNETMLPFNPVQDNETGNPNDLVYYAEHIRKAFGSKVIFEDLNLKLWRNDRIALMGPSGSGKTTILKMIAGLVKPDLGTHVWRGTVSMVFDEDDLYPALTAFRNIELGTNWGYSEKKERQDAVKEWAQIFECEEFLNQTVSTLSAGQRKRVALARAMMKEPQVLLLDETFHALDPSLRQQIISTLLILQRQHGFALVLATHHEEEATAMQARTIYLNEIQSAETE